jgi:hypothetical protein
MSRHSARSTMMRNIRLAAIALVTCAAIAGVEAQRPDFSGRWVAEVPPAPPPSPGSPAVLRGDMGSGWGTPLTITHTAAELIVEHALFSRYDLQPPLRFVFKLDGSESRNTTMAGHATQTRVSRAEWDGTVLKIVTAYPGIDPGTGKPFTTTVTQRVSLPSPASLVIETVRSGVLGGRDTTSRTVYGIAP